MAVCIACLANLPLCFDDAAALSSHASSQVLKSSAAELKVWPLSSDHIKWAPSGVGNPSFGFTLPVEEVVSMHNGPIQLDPQGYQEWAPSGVGNPSFGFTLPVEEVVSMPDGPIELDTLDNKWAPSGVGNPLFGFTLPVEEVVPMPAELDLHDNFKSVALLVQTTFYRTKSSQLITVKDSHLLVCLYLLLRIAQLMFFLLLQDRVKNGQQMLPSDLKKLKLR
ncbi:MAG: hypothetical protein ACRDL7_12110, partial [Gaiellaceae bacterium]